ncbi:GEVED domain-containing protein [Lutibacter sp.]|uniref:GEVED domain-containing protein n=1 Tax=Lutibacter sp. TaxID=1925666 RepID=UPI0035673D33
MKKFSLFIVVIVALLFSSIGSAQYCDSYGNTFYDTGITRVNLNTINNDDVTKNNGYEDFTSQSTSLTQGISYPLTVNVNTDGNYTVETRVWIDWNQDGDFFDTNEEYDLGTANNGTNIATDKSPLSILVPSTANLGPTRMRVSVRFSSAPSVCDTNFDGEVEDYTVNIVSATPMPEINIQGLGNTIFTGDNTPSTTDGTDFGSVLTSSGTQVSTFTIQNAGTLNLSLTGASPYVTISGANASDFSVTAIPAGNIAGGGTNSTTFQITFDPSATGVRTATVSIANNDTTGGENPYTFTVQGTGISTLTYCSSYGSTSEDTGITRVIFNTIDNADVTKNTSYEDFTAISTNVTQGTSYPLTVYVNNGEYQNNKNKWRHNNNTYVYVWIDWNQDGDFTDTNEEYYLGAGSTTNGATSLSPLSITVPVGAATGATRMRVSTKYDDSTFTSCDTNFDGEVEDYTVNIISGCSTYSLTNTAIVTTPICAGTAATVRLTGTAANLPTGSYTVTYNLTGTNTATANTATMTVSTAGTGTFTTSNLAYSGITTVTITNLSKGTCSNAISTNRTAIVTVLAAPSQPSTITGNTVPCQGSSQVYYVEYTLGVFYTWTLPTGWTQTAGGNTNSITVTVGSGSGNITVTPSNGICTGTLRTLAVTPSTVPAQPSTITGNTSVCQGTTGVTYSVTNVSGVTYNWVLPSGWTKTAGGTTNSIIVTAGTTGGTITVTPSNACGSGTARTLAVATTTVPSQPSTITGNTSVCQGTTGLTYTVTNVSGVTYNWVLPSGWTQTAGGTTNSITVTAGTTGGTITVTPSNTCGNGTARSFAVSTTTLPSQPSTITGTTTPCQGTSQTYSVTSVSGVSYSWTLPTGWTQTGGTTTNSIIVTVGSGSGNITVTPSNVTCTGTPRTLAVTPSTVPTQPSTITGNTSVCQGTTGLTYSVTNVSGVTYNWVLPSGWTQTAGGTTNSITVTAGTSGGTIRVTPSNACGSGTARTLAVSTTAVPSQPSVISGILSPCVGSSQTYSVTSVSGVSYSWALPSGWTQTGGGITNSITVTVGSAGGNIVVTPSNTCGTGTSNSISVTTTAAPTIDSTTPDTREGAGVVTLGATASSGIISWYAALTGGTALATGTSYSPTVSATTTYYVETNNGTCTSSPRTPVTATVLAVTPFTIYYENFDENNGTWVMTNTGSGSVWAHGTGLAASSENAEGSYWYTNNYNNYANNSYTYATSPILSSVGYTDLTFSADVRYNLDADTNDGVRVEYRKRTSGTWGSWSVLGSYNSGINWYDGNGNVNAIAAGSNGWTGNTGNITDSTIDNNNFFETATNPLPTELNNTDEFQVRFVFASNANTTDDGAAFDNILIYGTPITPTQPVSGPGSMNNNLKLWLNATSEIGVITSGTDITNWQDQAFNNHANGLTTNSPSFENSSTENINFNPVIKFDRSSKEYLRGKGGYFSQDYFVVVKSNGTIDNTGTNRQVPIAGRVSKDSPDVDGTGLGLGSISLRFTDEVVAHMSSSVPTTPSASSEQQYGRAFTSTTKSYIDEVIIYNVKTNSTGTQTEIYKNGVKIDNTNGQSYNQTTNTYGGDLNFSEFSNQQFYVGVGRFSLNGNVDAYVDGKITEIISYGATNTTLGQQKIQSYLAIKNGVTLGADGQATQNYIDSAGNIIWNTTANLGYNYDIAGIGRDDNSKLNQKQSKSVNDTNAITIGLNEIAATNSANTNTFTTDKDFLVWGHNNAALSGSTVLSVNLGAPSTTVTTIFDRKWKIVESRPTASNDILDVKISLPTAILPSKLSTQEYALIVSSSAAFGANDIVDIIPLKENGTNHETWYDFDETRFFTFGIASRNTGKYNVSFSSGDYLVGENVVNLNSAFTVSAWVRNLGAGGTIVSKGTAYDFKLNSSGNVEVRINGTLRATSVTAIKDAKWHQIAAVNNGSNLLIYVDGILDSTHTVASPTNTTDRFAIGVVYTNKKTISTPFNGDIDEVRIWDSALAQNQIQFIMNQEIENLSAKVKGSALPQTVTLNTISSVDWSTIKVYHNLNNFYGTTVEDASNNKNWLRIKYLTVGKNIIYNQTAPLPYVSTANLDWDLESTWVNGTTQKIPGSASIVNSAVTVDWNIVQISSNVTVENTSLPTANLGNRKLLGLLIDSSKQLTAIGTNPTTTDAYSGTGNGLTVSHYLKIDGKLDLNGESQLIQTTDSDFDSASIGIIERDQQGVGNKYRYNKWSFPVYTGTNSTVGRNYTTVAASLRDGTDSTNPQTITFNNTGYDGATTTPITLSTYWMYKYADAPDGDYSKWQQIRSTGELYSGEGFILKGPGTIYDQNYIIQGKPNNGTITLPIGAGNDYLVGNPYPSAIDAYQFIDDNPQITGPLYFWEHYGNDSHILAQYQAGYATLTKADGVIAASHSSVSNAGTATKKPGRYVPVGQGFFVYSEKGGTITFNNNQRIFYEEEPRTGSNYGSVFMKGTTNSKNSSESTLNNSNLDLRQKIRLGFTGSKINYRQISLTIDENTTDEVDYGYEAEIYEIFGDDMFWVIGDDKYVIQATNELSIDKEIPLGIITSGSAIKISVDSVENLSEATNIYIKDNTTQQVVDITTTPFEITLPAGEYKTKYSLVFKDANSLSVEDEILQAGTLVYMNNASSELQITNNSGTVIDWVIIYNQLGQVMKHYKNTSKESALSIPMNVSSGVYFVTINTEKGSFNKKIIIQ